MVKRVFGYLFVASCLLVSSCTSNSDIENKFAASQHDQFNEAFYKTFGRNIDPTHNWGFTSVTPAEASSFELTEDCFISEGAGTRAEDVTLLDNKVLQTYKRSTGAGNLTEATAYFFVQSPLKEITSADLSNVSTWKYWPQTDSKKSGYMARSIGKVNPSLMSNGELLYVFDATGTNVNKVLVQAPTMEDVWEFFRDGITTISKEDFVKKHKVIWYVAKLQDDSRTGGNDQLFHVDGFVVPKDVPVIPPCARIIAEDLGVAESDFDYNDVVIDASLAADNFKQTHLYIVLRAAGKTLPITINDKSVDKNMWNTNPCDYSKSEFFSDEIVSNNYQFKDIKIVANGTEIQANTGKPAEKIEVPVTFKWAPEKKAIGEISNFSDYVNNTNIKLTNK